MKWEQKIIDLQEPSIRALMLAQNERPLEHDSMYIHTIKNTAIAMEAQCVKEDGTVDLNVRQIYDENGQVLADITFAASARANAGASLERFRDDKPASTLTEEKRDRGTGAFMRAISMDALKNRFKSIMNSMFKPSHAEVMAESIKKAKE